MEKIKNKLGNVGIVFSIVMGYLVAFYMYFNRYLEKNTEVNKQIKGLLSDMSIVPEKETAFLLLLAGVCSLVIYIVAVVIYKFIFRIAKVEVPEKKMLFAVALAYMFDFFACYFALGYFTNMLLIVLMGNILEIAIVFILSFEKVQISMFKAVVIRTLLLAGNCVCLLLNV